MNSSSSPQPPREPFNEVEANLGQPTLNANKAIPSRLSLPGKILGIDFGERRLGLAIGSLELGVATGLDTFDRKTRPDIWTPLSEIIRKEKISALVIGYPLRTDGLELANSKTMAVDAFITELETHTGLPVYREDEAYTSQLAEEALRARRGGKSTKGKRRTGKQKGEIDRLAACFILQDFLDRGGPA
jgi:putative Holliday junction resolvase